MSKDWSTDEKKRENVRMSAIMASIMAMGTPNELIERRREKKYTICLMPNCYNETQHNGGYCCAEHCKAHKEMKKR